jgi:hypothetical protein
MRKHLISASVFFAAFAAFAAGQARAVEYAPAQVLFTAGAEKEAVPGVGVYAFFMDISSPAGGWRADFGYAGVTHARKLGERFDLWAAALGVVSTNYFTGHDAYGPSFWLALNSYYTTLFLEGDGYFGKDGRRAYYGLYTFDGKPSQWSRLGVQVEQIDKAFQFGPHACVKSGPAKLCTNWYWKPDHDSVFTRFSAGFDF